MIVENTSISIDVTAIIYVVVTEITIVFDEMAATDSIFKNNGIRLETQQSNKIKFNFITFSKSSVDHE